MDWTRISRRHARDGLNQKLTGDQRHLNAVLREGEPLVAVLQALTLVEERWWRQRSEIEA